jgi:hypothetical protein
MPATFTAKISIINGNPYVRPPDKVLSPIFKASGKSTSSIPVRGKINGAPFQQSLVRYQGDWRLYVNIIMAKASKTTFRKSISEIVGRRVTIAVEFDPQPPHYKMLPFLKKALDVNPAAYSNWNKLPPSRKKEVLRYFSQLKSDEAKKRNLGKLLEVLSGSDGRFMARDWKGGR